MAYSGRNIAEHIIPLEQEVAERIYGFYEAIGWLVLSSEEGRLLRAVPDMGDDIVDGIGYYRDDSDNRMAWFEDHSDPDDPSHLSKFTVGLRLPRLMDLIEVPLELPSNEHVHQLVALGGVLLDKHMHVKPREHFGRDEFRFGDPLLLGVRVTGPRQVRSDD